MTAYLRLSMMVVLLKRKTISQAACLCPMRTMPMKTHFPQPFAPTIMVTGKRNSITCSSLSGEKDLTPRIESLLMDAISQSVSQYNASELRLTTMQDESDRKGFANAMEHDVYMHLSQREWPGPKILIRRAHNLSKFDTINIVLVSI